LFADDPDAGFLPNPRAGAAHPYRWFAHARDVRGDGAPVLAAPDPPLLAPLGDGLDAAAIQGLGQSPYGGRAEHELLAAVRETARVVPGTKMIKPLSPHQVARVLTSAPRVWGVCFREHDTAHLRTPDDRRVLDGDPHPGDEAVFALRFRACDAADFTTPSIRDYAGLVSMAGSDRRGAPVLGTGFLPSRAELIPEFVTVDIADLPLPDRSELLAYTPDGSEIVVYQYLSERGAWTRMAGRQWRDFLHVLPGVPPNQEAFPVANATHIGLFGTYSGRQYPAVADPPHEYRVRAKSAAARFVVTNVVRSHLVGRWRDTDCVIAGTKDDWVRVRLRHPDTEAVKITDAECTERAVYECWVPGRELEDVQQIEHTYAAT
jgi:hypothetical protein